MGYDYAIYSVDMQDWQVQPDSLRQLSPPGWFIQPMTSPDGQWCTFWGRQDGETGFNIWRCRTDGGDLEKLTDHQAVSGHPVWCDHGRRIVYSTTWQASNTTDWQMDTQFDIDRPARHIWVMNADGSEPRPLTTGDCTDERPTLSPDNRWLVFVSNRGGTLNLWVNDLQTGTLRKLFPGQRHLEYRPIFSHDGRRLAFFLADQAPDVHTLCICSWPDCTLTTLPNDSFLWMHGPWFLADNETLLCHAHRIGDPTCGIFRLPPGTAEPIRIDLPGDPPHAHATTDLQAQRLIFDATPDLLQQARPAPQS